MSFFDWFRRPRAVVYEMPIELAQLPEKVDSETMRGLMVHPGFRNVLYKLRVMKAVLEQQLRTEEHKDLTEVFRTQARINAIHWLEKQLEHAVKAPIKAKVIEIDEFEAALAHANLIVEEVGK